jgi:hypothetical protein
MSATLCLCVILFRGEPFRSSWTVDYWLQLCGEIQRVRRRTVFVNAETSKLSSTHLSQQLDDFPIPVLLLPVSSPGNEDRWNAIRDPTDVIIIVLSNWLGMALQSPPVGRH